MSEARTHAGFQTEMSLILRALGNMCRIPWNLAHCTAGDGQGSMLNLAKGLKKPTTLLLHPLRQDLVVLVYKHKDRYLSNMRQRTSGMISAKLIIVWLLRKVSKTSWKVSQPSAFTAEPGLAGQRSLCSSLCIKYKERLSRPI